MPHSTQQANHKTGSQWSFVFDALSEGASCALAADIARVLGAGDCLALDGDLGLGKSTFARALLRARADDAYLEVPSPTFTLVQTYEMPADGGSLEISHFDLYRISDFEELYEIGLEESWQAGAALIEWPDRAEDMLPEETLWLHFTPSDDNAYRKLTLSGQGTWRSRLQRLCEQRQLLIDANWGAGVIKPIASDLSPRQYARVTLPLLEDETPDTRETNAILMDMPKREPGPPLADGRLYDLVAHRVTELAPMISICEGLASIGLHVPQIYGFDASKGLMLWEDFGDETLATGPEEPIADRYIAVAKALADLHERAQPNHFDGAGGPHNLSPYDTDAFAVELDVFLDHYWPHVKNTPCPVDERDRFHALWRPLITLLTKAEQGLVLRDVQDPNCFWVADRDPSRPVGFIDFQDCLLGPTAYDLSALASDARVTISKGLETDILTAYQAQRAFTSERAEAFQADYCLCVAQRTMKNLGAFARAANQWDRPGYLSHVPRSLAYLHKALSHPLLADLKDWYDFHQLDG